MTDPYLPPGVSDRDIDAHYGEHEQCRTCGKRPADCECEEFVPGEVLPWKDDARFEDWYRKDA